jgi:outer membrane PBP1 activator LpoA protein
MEYASEDILQRYVAKQEDLYGRIVKELKEVQQDIHLVCAVPTAPSSPQITKLGDELAQLRRIADVTEARLQRIQEDKEKATNALKQEKYESLKQLQVVRYSVSAYKSEREEFQVML